MSRTTWAQVRVPAVSISCLGCLGPVSEVPQCLPAVPGDSGTFPRPAGLIRCPGQVGPSLRACGVDQVSRKPRPRSEFSRCPPAVPDYSRSGPRARGVTSWPGRLILGSEFPRCQPAVLDDSRPYPRARGFNLLSRVTRARVRGPAALTSCPGRSGPCPRAHRVDHLSWATRAWDRWPAASTICRGLHGLVSLSQSWWNRPAVPGNSRLCLRAHGVEHLSRATRVWVRVLVGSTSYAGHLGPWSEGPRV